MAAGHVAAVAILVPGLVGITLAVAVRLQDGVGPDHGQALLGGELLDKGVSLVAVTAFLVSWVTVGSIQLPMALELDSSLSGVIQGALVLAALGVHAWQKKNAKGIAHGA